MWLRKILRLNQIYDCPTAGRIVLGILIGWGVFIVFTTFLPAIVRDIENAILKNAILVFGTLIIFFVTSVYSLRSLFLKFYINRLFKNRHLSLLGSSPSEATIARIKASSIGGEFNAETNFLISRTDMTVSLIDEKIIGGQLKPTVGPAKRQLVYNMYDIVTNIWQHAKRGDHKVRQAYYTVFEAKLPQKTPHLIFDSRSAKGKQFKSIYLKSQRLPIETYLNDFFDIYSPQYHQIEALSFITPEVVEAMINLKDCDIEFIDDRFFCYAPLLEENSLKDLRERCLVLQAKVQDNLHSYKEEPDKVAPLGQRLLKNPWRHLPLAIIYGCLVFFLGGLTLLTVGGENFDVRFPLMAILFLFGLIYSIWNIISTRRKNKQIELSFLSQRDKKTLSS